MQNGQNTSISPSNLDILVQLATYECPASLAGGILTMDDCTTLDILNLVSEIKNLTNQRQLLADALGRCISAAGIVRPNVALSGPELLIFAEDVTALLQTRTSALVDTTEDITVMPAQPIQAFLNVLAKADSVTVADSPLLSSWDIETVTGEGENEIAIFSWVDDEGLKFGVVLTEEGIAAGTWTEDAFTCDDNEGDPVEIKFHKHLPLTFTVAQVQTEAVLTVVEDVRARAKKYAFKPNSSTVLDSISDSASLLGIELTTSQIQEAVDLILKG